MPVSNTFSFVMTEDSHLIPEEILGVGIQRVQKINPRHSPTSSKYVDKMR